MHELRQHFLRALLMTLLASALAACEVDGVESEPMPNPESQTAELGLQQERSVSTPLEADQAESEPDPKEDPCDEVTQAKMELIEANSNWSFGTMDPDHPDYCDIIEGTYDLLLDYLETEPEMVKEKIVFHVKNEKRFVNGVSIAAYTQPYGKSHTITFYNPQAP